MSHPLHLLPSLLFLPHARALFLGLFLPAVLPSRRPSTRLPSFERLVFQARDLAKAEGVPLSRDALAAFLGALLRRRVHVVLAVDPTPPTGVVPRAPLLGPAAELPLAEVALPGPLACCGGGAL